MVAHRAGEWVAGSDGERRGDAGVAAGECDAYQRIAAFMSDVRQPRLLALVNGTALPGVVSAELSGSGAFQADRFRLDAALNASSQFGLDYWSADGTPVVDLQFSLDGGGNYASLMIGQVDRISADPVNGRISLSGRDLSARLIDQTTDEGFANQTSSDVATLLAQRRGLQATVSATTTLVGRYYQDDHHQLGLGRFSRARSEWDVLVDLARREGYSVFVSGATLFFQPLDQAAVFSVYWDQVARDSNVKSLKLDWLPAIANGVQVVVQSWHSKQGNAVSARAGAGGGTVSTVLRANLTESDAQTLATQYLNELLGQERSISFDLPGELTLTPRSLVQVTGDVAGWGGLYQVVDVTRRLDIRGGFSQSVSARGYTPA